ncbi:TetR/AcrR family transcriptional regulator [Radiobacillus kanasensis]|uniref:TetR/AcrR family transcriptional regulator n=1 Tax=Radiobacillus kanasensis TaxID=2844358 RepID=UPI001E4A3C16|nr:TetR/AcrR family transcriptional regulator [Radiobacillus kanasensis]UFT99331.1 TetR/AcrR family transcriptional regulator [Radiobacillus kanasensis]
MDGFERRRELKKMEILKAALSLFMKYGVQKVSVAEIAKEASVSQVTIYNYFENKHKLVTEVITYYVDKEWARAEELLESDLPFPEKIKQVIFQNAKVANDIHEDFYEYVMKEYAGENNYFETFYVEKAMPRLSAFFQSGKDEGYIDSTISNEAILVYIQMYSDYLSNEEVYKRTLHLSEDLTKLFFYGIVGKGAN